MHALLASPLRYPGMPCRSALGMEDAQVNLGLVEAEPWDLARLLVAEFALTYGNDWLVVPVDVPFGSLVTVESVMYMTTFGERFGVQPTAQVSPDGHWQMFRMTERPAGRGRQAYVDGRLFRTADSARRRRGAGRPGDTRRCCSCATRWRTCAGRWSAASRGRAAPPATGAGSETRADARTSGR